MVVSIHQPNFFPYEGVLDKIRRSDIHVVLAHAQFERGNYQNRFGRGGYWYTMSVSQKLEPLVEKRYTKPHEDFAAILRRLPERAGLLAEFTDLIGESLVETNVGILRRICERLRITTPIVLDHPTDLRSTERLVDLCQQHGATTYLSGASGPKYLDISLFARAGVRVEVQDIALTGRRAAIDVVAGAGQ